MGKFSKSQNKQRKLRRHREARKRRKEILRRRASEPKPWVPQKMHFFKMPNLFRDDVPKETSIVFFESPFRVVSSLETILKIYGDIEVFVGREFTKI